ncbi:MAG: hypothetical protein AAGG02_21460 [Cyanobacteria bacterium P01_H01_bin.15]
MASIPYSFRRRGISPLFYPQKFLVHLVHPLAVFHLLHRHPHQAMLSEDGWVVNICDSFDAAKTYVINNHAKPSFEVLGENLIKRVTLIAEDEQIIKVFYPVFPSDKNADEVIELLTSQLFSTF